MIIKLRRRKKLILLIIYIFILITDRCTQTSISYFLSYQLHRYLGEILQTWRYKKAIATYDSIKRVLQYSNQYLRINAHCSKRDDENHRIIAYIVRPCTQTWPEYQNYCNTTLPLTSAHRLFNFHQWPDTFAVYHLQVLACNFLNLRHDARDS